MRVAVVFPRANRRAGVERVAWDLSNELGRYHQTTFVGTELEAAEETAALFCRVKPSVGLPSVIAFRRAARDALAHLDPDVTLSLGVQCPTGDVCWVQSIHKAYLNQGIGAMVRGRSTPGWLRRILPRHQLVLAAERAYFGAQRLQRVLCTSERERDDVVSLYGVDPTRCIVVPNGYDPTIFNAEEALSKRGAIRKRLQIGEDALSFLFVANELHRKGFGTLIEAFARAAGGQSRLDVVGRVDGSDYERVMAKLGVSDSVHWHGPSPDVSDYYAAADVMVLPTRYEPFGIVIIEALASGLPVISSRLAGASGAVEEGRAGLVLDDPTDVNELARCLDAAADHDVRAEWAANAPAAALPFTWPRVAANVEKILEDVALPQR